MHVPSNLTVGDATLTPRWRGRELLSLGNVTIQGVNLRNDSTRFLPWFDAYEGGIFRTFQYRDLRQEHDGIRLVLSSEADMDYPFMERRDSSGDVCLPRRSWDAEPYQAELHVILSPASAEIDGHCFTGVTYAFEVHSPECPIHRLLDRQTWELGGNLDDVTLHCRNLFDLPRKTITTDTGYSSVGLDNWAGLLPGNLWARWSLMPAFDMQTGADGILLGWFETVSCIRTVVESTPGEEWIRYVDAHYQEASTAFRTNPKSILYCADRLDATEAVNLWTRVHDLEADKARRVLGIASEPPVGPVLSCNLWQGIKFDTAYDQALEQAARLGVEYLFIDSCFQNGETLRVHMQEAFNGEEWNGTAVDKFQHGHMCLTLDFEVSETAGGEAALKRLCDKAKEKGIHILSWMSTHYWPPTNVAKDPALRHGKFGVYAAKESGRHPDTGYAGDCWTLNLNGPVYEKVRDQIVGICERTGLAGFLWDSFSNLGWWQVDYSDGSMRPQAARMGQLFAELTNRGLYLMPEAMVSFTSHSVLGLHGGNVFAGDLAGYAYNTSIGLTYDGVDHAQEILRGREPIDLLFRSYAFGRVCTMSARGIPDHELCAAAVDAVRSLNQTWQALRYLMQRRTVLSEDRGVLWEETAGGAGVLFSFRAQEWPTACRDTADSNSSSTRRLDANRIYLING